MRDSFIFYKSFYDAISYLDEKDQGEVYKAIIEYALTGKEPELKGAAMGMFLSFKPQIDANARKYENGCKGGRPKKSQNETKKKPKQNQNITKEKPNQNLNEAKAKPNDNENDNENINENEYNPLTPLQGEQVDKKKSTSEIVDEKNFSSELREHVVNWIDYKKEKRQAYKERGLRTFLSQVENQVATHGEKAVISVIDSSMAANYQGVVWEKIKAPPRQKVMNWDALV